MKLKRLWKLRPTNKLCTDFFVLDVETCKTKKYKNGTEKLFWCLDGTPKSFKFAVIYGYNFHRVYHSLKELIYDLYNEPRFKKKIIYAHNGGRYDWPCIFGIIFDVDEKPIFVGSRLISFTNGHCTFADSINIFVGLSVKAIGKMMGNQKLGMSNDYKFSVWPKDKERDINGCTKDCVIIWDALFSVFEFAGKIKLTQASLSMNYFRTYHQPFHIDHNENVKFFWLSYYGGRTEALKVGKTKAYVIDVNSMYPWMMKKLKFPNPKILKHEIDLDVKRFLKYLEWYEGCANLTIYHKEHKYGFLPYKSNGKLLFPIGEFSGTWNFPEIRFALEQGVIEIKKVNWSVYSEPMDSPFISFVDCLNDMKTKAKIEGNKFEEDRAKRFSNSLYGKFGQHISQETIYIRSITKQWDIIQEYEKKGLFVKLITFNKKRDDAFLVTKSSRKECSYSIPSFASYITSGGRVELLRKALTMDANKIVYWDTDSLFFEILTPDIVSEKQLGGWKVEDKIVTHITTVKNYRYYEIEKPHEEILRCKGVPKIRKDEHGKPTTTKIYKEDCTFEEVPTVEQVSDSEFIYYNLMQTKEALKRGLEPGVITKRTKKIKHKYDKRKILDDGNTKPILI